MGRPEPRPLGAALPAYGARDGAPGAAQPEGVPAAELAAEPVGVLTLRDALAAALLRNAELAAFSEQIRVREAQALQAGLRPNPELALEVENLAGSGSFRGARQSETTLEFSQRIELGGKRGGRRRVAELDAALAGWDYEVRRVAVCSEVARAFAEVLAAQEQLALSRQLAELAGASLASVRRQVGAGTTSAVEQIRAEVAFASQEIDSQRAEAALASARLRLAALWGSAEARFEAARGDVRAVEPPPPLPSLLARLEQGPDLARRAEEIAQRRAVVALEEAKGIPDVTASAGLRRFEETDDTALLFGVSIPLPVYDRNQGARLAAERAVARARHLQRAERVRAEVSLRASFRELAASFAEMRSLRDVAIPRAEAAHRDVREGHRGGLFRDVDVLDAQRALLELRGRELDALRRYYGAVAEIERLTGFPLGPAVCRVPARRGRSAPAATGDPMRVRVPKRRGCTLLAALAVAAALACGDERGGEEHAHEEAHAEHAHEGDHAEHAQVGAHAQAGAHAGEHADAERSAGAARAERAREGEQAGGHPGERVRLSRDVLEEFGIEVATAGPGVLVREVSLPAEVRPNQDGLAHIAARFAGVAIEVRRAVGDAVQAGETLAVIEASQSLAPYPLKTLIDGVVIERHLTRGEPVSQQGGPLFTVADLRTVWIDLSAYQRYLPELAVGQRVAVSAGHGLPHAAGVLSYVAPVVDETTRTATARVVLENPDGIWRPGMFVTARVEVGRQEVAVAVPRSALATLGGRPAVFVQGDDGFAPRAVELGREAEDSVEIRAGLAAGERFAARGGFTLRSELAREELSGGHAH